MRRFASSITLRLVPGGAARTSRHMRWAKGQDGPGKRPTEAEAGDQNDTEKHVGGEEPDRYHGRVKQSRYDEPGQVGQAEITAERQVIVPETSAPA
jgi:hypothetical protein